MPAPIDYDFPDAPRVTSGGLSAPLEVPQVAPGTRKLHQLVMPRGSISSYRPSAALERHIHRQLGTQPF